jgi:pSer/pThr/pTyr-binding forkhead associated (FHA) protein
MRFRLRYMNHDLELNEGEFVVGRNASCQLSLDDPLVSRRHAIFMVLPDAVTVEDLGSRNGVSVNGERIGGRVLLRPGDRVQIGSQEMVLVAGATEAVRTATRNPLKMTMPRLPDSPAMSTKPPSQSDADPEASMVRRADAFNLLGSVAEKALAMGKHVEAERILASPLGDVIEASRAGKRITPSLLDQAARFSARLATATGKGAWADYVIELYQSQGRLVPAPVIDELYNAFRRVSAIDLGRLRDYVAALRDQVHQFGPAERFLFQRIEGLERLAAIR